MEEWLDSHPEFVQDYFKRKATQAMIDSWVMVHEVNNACHSPSVFTCDATSTGSSSRPNSGANTPVRKISAQEFDKRGQILKPMVSTVDGIPTFLGQEQMPASSSPKYRRTRSELRNLDEREMLHELVMDICNDLDLTSLCYKILQNVALLLSADRCSLFLVHGERDSSDRCLVSKLFDVSVSSTLEESVRRSEEIKVPWATGIIGYVAETGQTVNISDAYQDSRFNKEIDLKTGYQTHSILCMPINDFDGEVIGVAQAINKLGTTDEVFNKTDEKVFASYLAFCGIGIHNAQLYERSLLENRRNQLLLDLAWVIFEEQNNVANLIYKIMLHTQSLLRCEVCQVLLVEDAEQGSFSQVFELRSDDLDSDGSILKEGDLASRYPVGLGITSYVARTGEALNIPDAYNDNRFDPQADKNSDIETRNILCIPIKNSSGSVIGVAQLVNKVDGTHFNKNDENLFEAFAIFCGMGINNTQMYEQAVKAMARQRVALEVLSYHVSASAEEVHRFKKMVIPSAEQIQLLDYQFSDFHLDDDDTLKASIRMFLDLQLLDKFHIQYDVFLRWLLSVKKNYRAVAYHNWRHAFSVTQTMYAMLTKSGLISTFGDLETLALLVGCLSHDLDHRGTNNQFQIKTMSPLAQLYSTSTMERHHFDQCIMILNTKGNEIFANLTETDYQKVIRVLEHAILATDLALYFKHRKEFFLIIDAEVADWTEDAHRELLRSMMMTACDLSAITKPWEVQQTVAMLLANEFFEQGDLEKNELKVNPSDNMDRSKRDLLPSMQVNFIDSICLPVYDAFAKLDVRFGELLEGCRNNRVQWLQLATKHEHSINNSNNVEQNDNDLVNSS